MGKDYLFFYTESMIVCIIIFGILLVHDLIQGDRQERKFRFDNVLLAHIMYFACDGIWAAIIARAIQPNVYNVLLVNYLLLVLLALVGNTWFFFITVLTNMPRRTTKRGKLMIYAPMLVTCGVTLIGIIINPSIWVTEDLDTSVLFDILFLLAPLIYVICALIYSIYQAFRRENLLNRKLYLIAGIYPLAVLTAGVCQVTFINAPVFCFCSTIIIILFNIISMEEQISVDPLTKLNNRGQLMRYATQDSSIHKEGVRTFVVMSDVNNFKKINDTFGHAEGDHALVMIADALRRAAERSEIAPFLGRYGGDEFVMILFVPARKDTDEAVTAMIRSIRSDLADTCRRNNMPYIIGMGFGFSELVKHENFTDCLQRADKKLYEDKANIKAMMG